MSDTCQDTWELKHRVVQCDREHGHGGAHHAEVTEYNEHTERDFYFVMSWGPMPKLPARDGAAT